MLRQTPCKTEPALPLRRAQGRPYARVRDMPLRRVRPCLLHRARAIAQILGLWLVFVLLATACEAPSRHAVPVPTDPPRPTPTPTPPAPSVQGPLPGAQPKFERLSLEQGLSQSSPLAILEDGQGFLWVGTEDGLNRYDGHTFVVYRQDPDDPGSLSNSYVTALHEGASGALWVGTYGGGVNRFDPRTGRFAHYRHDPDDPNSLSDDQVLSVYEGRAGALWAGTRNHGLNRLDPDTGRFRRYRHDPENPYSLSHDTVLAIAQDIAGILWIGTSRGLDRLDPDTGHVMRTPCDPGEPQGFSCGAILTIYPDPSGALWLGIAGGLEQFDPRTGQVTHYRHDADDPHSLGHDVVRAMVRDASGTLWVATDGGLDRFDEGAQRFTHHRNDPSDPDSLSGDTVRSLCVDRSGGLWIGTYGAGLSRYDARKQQIAHYKADPSDPNNLSAHSIWAIYEDDEGLVWVGTDGGGLDRLDPASGDWSHYRHDPDDPNSLSRDVVLSIYGDDSGTLWLGTWGGGLNRFDPHTGEFTHYRSDPQDPTTLSSDVVWFIREDSLGALWMGTGDGLNRFDRESGQFTRYLYGPDDPFSLSDNNVGSMYEDRSGTLWFGTHNGLNRFDRETQRFARYQHDPRDPHSLSHNIVFSIHGDAAGTLWLGTWGGGLNRFDPQSETFAHYRVKDGLPNDVIYGILEDKAGYLWLSTNNGLSRFDPRSETFRNYDVGDGLQSVEFNYGAYHLGSSGAMYFGGINGLNAFYPDGVVDNTYVPPVVLTSLTQQGKRVDTGLAPEATSGVTFRWPDNDFEFEFAALSYYRPEQNQYAYMLEGYDDDWNTIGTRRFGGYTNLPGGDYVLHLKGSNNDGVWNEEGTAIRVTIIPPFWGTWWFAGIALLALAGVGIGGYGLRVKAVEGRSYQLEAEVASRTRELAALNAIAGVVSRSLDLDQILEDALKETLGVMGTEAGGIYILDEAERLLTIATSHGLTPEFVAEIDRLRLGEGFSGRAAMTGEPLVVRDISEDSRLTRTAALEEGHRSLAVTPLTSKGAVLGTLFVVSHGLREFSAQDVQLLTSIARQIGVAIENARLFEAEQHRADEFRVLAQVGRHMTLAPDIDGTLAQIVRLVQQALGYYHVGVALVEGDEVVYRVGAGALWDNPQFRFEPARLRVGEEGLTGWVAKIGEPLLVPDVSQEPRYVWMEGSDTRSEILVPITVQEQVIGVLDVQSDRLNAFDSTDLAVLQSLALQIGAAVENARLYEQAQQAAVVEERQRLARELHDAVTQTLFSASLIAEALPAAWDQDPEEGRELLDEMRGLNKGALAEMRALLLELRPAALLETRLEDLLRQITEAASGREGIPITVTVQGECSLPDEVHVALYRIAQEALNNVVKHAQASEAAVSLRCTPPLSSSPTGGTEEGQRVELCIRDNGRGCPLGEAPPGHLGLSIMRERAREIGAELEIESRPGEGTRIQVVWTKSDRP